MKALLIDDKTFLFDDINDLEHFLKLEFDRHFERILSREKLNLNRIDGQFSLKPYMRSFDYTISSVYDMREEKVEL